MPPGRHYSQSAAFVCHWHTGCNKRFASKRKLHRHLEQEHGLRRDAERGWRATGTGARARRRDQREMQASRPRSPRESGAAMPQSPCIASDRTSRVTFCLATAGMDRDDSDGLMVDALGTRSAAPLLVDGAQPFDWIGRKVAMGSISAGSSAAMPPPSAAPAVMPPFGLRGSSTTAERPPCSAEKPPASSAARPPFATCDEGARAVSFGVSPRPVPDRSPAGPCGDVDDDLWVPSPRRWNTWTRDSSVDAAKVRL